MRFPAILLVAMSLLGRPSYAWADEPAAHVPEPMYLDLARGLAPRAGELEANALVIVPMTGLGRGIEWAPEIEWAPADNVALELELPMRDTRIEAMKFMAQLTLGRRGRRVRHGVQLSVSVPIEGRAGAQALHVTTARLGRRIGLVALAGLRLTIPQGPGVPMPAGVFSPSVFVSLPNAHAFGLEVTLVGNRNESAMTVLPQLHLALGSKARLQLGLGVQRTQGTKAWTAITGARLIFER